MRLDICDFFVLWNLHSVSLRKNSVYLHKCLALGLRNHHVDVHSSEEADSGKHDETVGPDGLLSRETRKQENGRERRKSRQGQLPLCESSRSFWVTSFIFTPGGNSWKAGSRPRIIKATPQPFNHRDVCPPALRLGDMEVGCSPSKTGRRPQQGALFPHPGSRGLSAAFDLGSL